MVKMLHIGTSRRRAEFYYFATSRELAFGACPSSF